MNQKQELAREINHADFAHGWEPDCDIHDFIARRLIAAGYRKTRVITTVDEIDALPVGSVILTKDGTANQLDILAGTLNYGLADRRIWRRTDSTYLAPRIPDRLLPATVLWEPEA